jgi:hypothetical protein
MCGWLCNTNDATVLCNAHDIRTGRCNHGFAEEGILHCHRSILNDLNLPKFSDRDTRNTFQFLSDADSYFLVKNVPKSIWLPLAKEAVVDLYTSQYSLQ